MSRSCEDEKDSSESDTWSLEQSPAKKKKLCMSSIGASTAQLQAMERTRHGKRASLGSSLMKDPFSRFAGRGALQGTGRTWISKPFKKWKKAVKKMKISCQERDSHPAVGSRDVCS